MDQYFVYGIVFLAGGVVFSAVLIWLNKQKDTLEVRLYNQLGKTAMQIAHLQIDKKAADAAAANAAATEVAKQAAKASVASI